MQVASHQCEQTLDERAASATNQRSHLRKELPLVPKPSHLQTNEDSQVASFSQPFPSPSEAAIWYCRMRMDGRVHNSGDETMTSILPAVGRCLSDLKRLETVPPSQPMTKQVMQWADLAFSCPDAGAAFPGRASAIAEDSILAGPAPKSWDDAPHQSRRRPRHSRVAAPGRPPPLRTIAWQLGEEPTRPCHKQCYIVLSIPHHARRCRMLSLTTAGWLGV